jgi:hypothetical protein
MGIKWLKLKIKCTKFEKFIYSYTTQQQQGGGGSDWLNATRNTKRQGHNNSNEYQFWW